ncbi:MAG: bile acid:sodium symporter family protein [Flavobacteriaceae bacterium]|nr:bile acid:sodium symporter family protein [Flavobacteriaceae bacterium]
MVTTQITRAFPWLVSFSAAIALYYPPSFTWFSGPLITYGLGGIMLGMGITLQWKDFKEVGRTPRWVLLGIALQYTVMPFLGWVLGVLFELPTFFAVGLILVSCCPGGTASNVIAYLAKANVALSVAMTAISTFTAIVFTPLLTSKLSGTYVEVAASGLFFSTLKVVLLPITLGILINRYFPATTQRCIPFAPPVAVVLITLIVASIIGQGSEIILSAGLHLLCALLILHLMGFILGYLLSHWLLKNKEVSKTIAIEVGMQNSGLGVVLAQENFANPMTAIPAAISSLVHSIYGSIFTVLFSKPTKKKTL